MTPTDHPAALPEVEEWLVARGVPWEFDAAVPIAGIDIAAGLENQARLQPLDEEVVERYAADMIDGAEFPAVLLRRMDGESRPSPVGGNHRLAGAGRAGRSTHPAYLIGPIDDLTAHLLALEDNRRHGLPLSDEERLYHAVELMNTARYSQDEAAKVAGVAVSKLRLQLQANRASRRAMKLRVNGWNEISVTSRARLSAIDDDRVFAKATRAVVAGHVPATRVSDFVRRVVDSRTVSDAIAVVEEHVASARRHSYRSTGRPPSAARAARVRLLGDLDALLRFDPAGVAADCFTGSDRTRVSEQCKAAARHLMAIEQAVTR